MARKTTAAFFFCFFNMNMIGCGGTESSSPSMLIGGSDATMSGDFWSAETNTDDGGNAVMVMHDSNDGDGDAVVEDSAGWEDAQPSEIYDGNDDNNDGDGEEEASTPQCAMLVCDDQNKCTNDSCVDGECVHAPADCNDGVVCTDDWCNIEVGCANAPNDSECDDGNACTDDSCDAEDGCANAQIQATACDDGNPCTDDICDPATGCVHANNTDSCDDGNACTENDKCEVGKCVSGANWCDCADDSECAEHEDGNLCNGTLVCVNNKCVIDEATVVVCDMSGDTVCAKAVCNESDGECYKMPSEEDTLCDDGSACTEGDACKAGVCKGGPALNCDDGNACTDDWCDHKEGCTGALMVDKYCIGDICDGIKCGWDGQCDIVVKSDCDDGIACTMDSCEPNGWYAFCNHVPDASVVCDDSNICTLDYCDMSGECTLDYCDANGCAHKANTAKCDDANACTMDDKCAAGVCKGGPAPNCDDANACTDDWCNIEVGCAYAPNDSECDDGNACTDDWCDPTTGCSHATIAGCCHTNTDCGDANLCDGAEKCVNNVCMPGTPLSCDDGDICTNDFCFFVDGTCIHVSLDCYDGIACTLDSCEPSVGCVHEPNVGFCIDDNPCTDDSCDTASGCAHTNNTAPCNDWNACTTDICEDGKCVSVPIVCDDGNACTMDDKCAAGVCKGGPAPNCNDGNVCTYDSCNPASGCAHTNNTAPCDDGNACTMDDKCAAGVCKGGPAQNCTDLNVCTDDSCDPTSGCVNTTNNAPCDDGNPCTIETICISKKCTIIKMMDCSLPPGQVPCSWDFCDPTETAPWYCHHGATPDIDGDGLMGTCDPDTDGDGAPNMSDPDDDNDGVLDAEDGCPLTVNKGVDPDGDGLDNACDPTPNPK